VTFVKPNGNQIKYLILIAIFFASTICFSKTACTKSKEYEPSLCKVKIPKIATVLIEQNGAGQTPIDAGAERKCENFVLTPSKVKRYFRETMLFNETDFHYYKNVTPCFASGTLVFTDGRKAKWDIDAHQNGTLKIESNKEIYLLCDKCNFKPW
jgi:hypothetical protein